MASQKLRTTVAALTASAGLVVLLSGPASTFGLGVSGTDTVTGTVQGAVETTQQTAATTVTQVESTVQTTAQAVAAPAAPAPAPVQTTVQTVTAAPRQTASRATTPAKKRAATGAAPRTGRVQRVSSTREVTGTTSSAAKSVTPAVTRHTAAVRTHRTSSTAPSADGSGADAGPAQCDVSLLALLPGGDQLGALVTLVCDAANGLDLPSRIGPAEQSASPLLATVLEAFTSAPPGRARARSAAPGAHRAAAAESRPPAAGAALAGRPGAATAMPIGAGRGVSGATAYVDSFRVPYASIPSTGGVTATDSASKHHHAWFSGTSRGTEVLMAILFASLSILGGIVLWRLAVRWVVPHFA